MDSPYIGMRIELHASGSSDKYSRFEVILDGEKAGELQMKRENATRIADLLFGKHYKIVAIEYDHQGSVLPQGNSGGGKAKGKSE